MPVLLHWSSDRRFTLQAGIKSVNRKKIIRKNFSIQQRKKDTPKIALPLTRCAKFIFIASMKYIDLFLHKLYYSSTFVSQIKHWISIDYYPPHLDSVPNFGKVQYTLLLVYYLNIQRYSNIHNVNHLIKSRMVPSLNCKKINNLLLVIRIMLGLHDILIRWRLILKKPAVICALYHSFVVPVAISSKNVISRTFDMGQRYPGWDSLTYPILTSCFGWLIDVYNPHHIMVRPKNRFPAVYISPAHFTVDYLSLTNLIVYLGQLSLKRRWRAKRNSVPCVLQHLGVDLLIVWTLQRLHLWLVSFITTKRVNASIDKELNLWWTIYHDADKMGFSLKYTLVNVCWYQY